MQQPKWADSLIEEVLAQHNRTKAPRIKWIKSNSQSSSGWAYASNWNKVYRNYRWHRKYKKEQVDILIRVGENGGRMVLLHELAHWLVRARHHHDKVFWRKAWGLYFTYLNLDEIDYATKNEFSYMKTAQLVYNQITQ